MKDLKLNKKDIAEIVAAAYPEYRGRKFSLSFQKEYHMSDYWSEGSRTYVTAIKLENNHIQMSTPDAVALNPFKDQAHITFNIPKNAALVEHTYFCGKDLGIRIVVHPDTILIPKLIPGFSIITETINVNEEEIKDGKKRNFGKDDLAKT